MQTLKHAPMITNSQEKPFLSLWAEAQTSLLVTFPCWSAGFSNLSSHWECSPLKVLLLFCKMIVFDFSLRFSMWSFSRFYFPVRLRSLVCSCDWDSNYQDVLHFFFHGFTVIPTSLQAHLPVIFPILAVSSMRSRIFIHNLMNLFQCEVNKWLCFDVSVFITNLSFMVEPHVK